jgi:hypothetical protein
MEGLGLKGYIAQGGDVGSAVSRYLAEFVSCKGKLLIFLKKQVKCSRNSDPLEHVDCQAV